MIKGKHLIIVILVTALVLFAGTLLFETQERGAEATVMPADITVSLKNRGVTLAEAQYAYSTVGTTDYFELDYIDGMLITFAASFSPSLGTYTGITVSGDIGPGGITAAGVYNVTVTVNYMDGGVAKQTDKNVILTVNIVTLDIDFDVTERYYKDGVPGASAHYTVKPASVNNSSLKYSYYEDVNLTVLLDAAPEDAGEYYVKAYYDDINNLNYQGEAVSAFVIHPSEAVIVAQDAEIKYSGGAIGLIDALNATVQGQCSAGFSAEAYTGESFTVPAAEPISAAGVYRVLFRFSGGDANFVHPYSNEYYLTVSKAAVNFAVLPISLTWSGAVFDLNGLFGNEIKLFNTDYGTAITAAYGALSFEYSDKLGNPIAAPSEVGEYGVRFTCSATANYNAAESEISAYSIVKRGIEIDIEGNFDLPSDTLTSAYNPDGTEVLYNLKDDESNPLTEVLTKEEVTYYSVISESEDEELDGLPVMPGTYRVEIEAETEHFIGAKTLTLVITKVAFAQSIAIKHNGGDFVSGGSIPYTAAAVALEPNVDALYDIDGYTVEFEGIAPTVYARSTVKPRHAGTYCMYVTLADDLYQGEGSFIFTVTKLTVTVKPNDFSAVYGDRVYIVGGNLMYRAEDITVEGLASGDTPSSIVDNIRIIIGESDATQTSAEFGAGSYTLRTALKTESAHPSYIIDVSESDTGTLTITKRALTVSVNDITVAVGTAITPSIKNITGFAYADASNQAISSAITYEYYSGEELLGAVPEATGLYTVKAVGTLLNYTINSVDGILTVCNSSLADLNLLPFSAEGKFAPEETLRIVYGGVSDEIKLAIKDKLPKHTAVRVFNVIEKAGTADGTGLKVIFNISDIDESDDFKVLAKYGNAYTEVDFAINGGIVTIDEIAMADAYILCDIDKIDYMWYIFGGAIFLIIAIVAGVIIRIYLTGGFKKKFKNDGKAVTAQPVGKKYSDIDEIEEAIQSFDESTVVREMTPAEKLEMKRKEEQYEQYKLKLQRLRSTGDKTFEDSLKKSGIKNIDDDLIIEKMIEADEERMRRIEEEARLEKEAAEREKEKPKAVILPKNTESYEQKSFAPKPKDEDDLDIDI